LDYLRDYFSQISEKERRNVKYFVSDLYDGYRTIHKEFFKNSHHIADFYHITIQLSTVVNIIRTNIMKQLDINSIEYKFMKKYWKLFISHN
jgi:transposase